MSGALDHVGAASGPSLAVNELDSTSIDDELDLVLDSTSIDDELDLAELDLAELPDLVEELDDVPVFASAYDCQEA